MEAAKAQQTVSGRPEALVAVGEWMGCPGRGCEKGAVYVEAPGLNTLVACTSCDGRGYIEIFRRHDPTRIS